MPKQEGAEDKNHQIRVSFLEEVLFTFCYCVLENQIKNIARFRVADYTTLQGPATEGWFLKVVLMSVESNLHQGQSYYMN